ncbi:threonine/serine dehydratase [Micromonospora psammae]|uniref:threonine/serine dehydratase n=1 Tax=Micromonospora sp. CPCC 205556 TaxID=3122398 RepID=UPI002FF006E7
MITRVDVEVAARRTAGRTRRTPVVTAGPDLVPPETVFKLEFLQHTGSFKARGAFNRILAAAEQGQLDPSVGVVVASGGNAGLANAYAAAQLGVPATVFVPQGAPPVKVDRLRAYGATVVARGNEYAEAYQAAVAHASTTGAVYCHAYDQPEIAAGAGTLGLELRDQVGGGLDTVLVAVGGGGLMAGVAAALEGEVRVVAVEPASVPTLHAALSAGAPVDVGVSGVAADSLGARRVGDIAFEVAVRTGVRSVLVSEEEIVAARHRLWQDWRVAVEHGAAVALAALTSGAYVPEPGERLAVVLCGANTGLHDLP